MKIIQLLLLASILNYCFALETDNFTLRYARLADTRVQLNLVMREFLNQISVNMNNHPEQSCNKEQIYKEAGFVLDGGPVESLVLSNVEKRINQNSQIPQRQIKYEDSIYNLPPQNEFNFLLDSGYLQGKMGVSMMKFPAMVNENLLAPIVKISNILIGTDKIGHFIGVGLAYYKYYHQLNPSMSDEEKLQESILDARIDEETIWGAQMSGVISYGDLYSNYQGFKFWQDLYGKPDSYLVCNNQKLEVNQGRVFDWSDYVNPAWDEAINCNEYGAGPQKIINYNFRERNLSCPMPREAYKCILIPESPHLEDLLHPSCFEIWKSRKKIISNQDSPQT